MSLGRRRTIVETSLRDVSIVAQSPVEEASKRGLQKRPRASNRLFAPRRSKLRLYRWFPTPPSPTWPDFLVDPRRSLGALRCDRPAVAREQFQESETTLRAPAECTARGRQLPLCLRRPPSPVRSRCRSGLSLLSNLKSFFRTVSSR